MICFLADIRSGKLLKEATYYVTQQTTTKSTHYDSLLFEDDEKECFCDGDLNALKKKIVYSASNRPKKMLSVYWIIERKAGFSVWIDRGES